MALTVKIYLRTSKVAQQVNVLTGSIPGIHAVGEKAHKLTSDFHTCTCMYAHIHCAHTQRHILSVCFPSGKWPQCYRIGTVLAQERGPVNAKHCCHRHPSNPKDPWAFTVPLSLPVPAWQPCQSACIHNYCSAEPSCSSPSPPLLLMIIDLPPSIGSAAFLGLTQK